jgi:uncharacterized protein involved in exopolysaccharide biosynthesis
MGETIYPRIDGRSALTLQRNWLVVGFRHRRLIAISFLGAFTGAVLAAFLLPARYQANTKILVKHERQDPLVTPDASTLPQVPQGLTETELNSEIVLTKSPDLLEAVVTICGLQKKSGRSGWQSWFSGAGEDPKKELAAAVRELGSALKVELLTKTNLISITYEDSNPQRAAQVLHTLVNLYLEKHLALHRSAGAFEFFQQESQQHKQGLEEAESRLVDFSQKQDAVSPGQQKAATLQKLSEFQSELKQTEVSIAETENRIRTLEGQASALPRRMTTQVRTADNPQLIEQLHTTLLNFELKRTELLQKFEPTYRLVQEVDTQIAQTRTAIADAEKLRDETTDRNPIFEWVDSELTKARSQLAAERARAETLKRTVRSYGEEASNLDRKEVIEQRLVRDQKAKEANYLLYLRKQEEARISDALDRSRIVNVAVAEAATVPAMPSRSRGTTLLIGFLAAIAVSLAAAGAAEHLNPSLRTSAEVQELLDVPVLALVSTGDGLDHANEGSSPTRIEPLS